MADDVLRQWPQWAAAFDPTGQLAQAWGARPPTPPPAPPSYSDVFERFAAAARAARGQGAAPGAGAGPEAAARLFADWLRDQFRDPGALWGSQPFAAPATWGSLPAVGLWREHQLQAERIARAWQRTEESRQRCVLLWSNMLREAADAFSRGLVGRPPATSAATAAVDARQLYDQWINAAEDAYARMARSDDFVKAQADFINASGEMRRELSNYASSCAKFLDLPTRAELDTLNERLRALQATVDKLLARRPASHEEKP